MRSIVPLQSSLLARIIFLFGALVTVPLAVTGALLSVTGRESVLSSGAELSNVGEETFSESTAHLARLATRRMESTANQLIEIGQRHVTQLGDDQVRLSSEVLKDSSRRLSTTTTATLKNATERMTRSTDVVLERSSAELRRLEARAIEETSATLIAEARRAFEETGKQLALANQESMDRLATELNLERARRTAEKTQFLLARTHEVIRQETRLPGRGSRLTEEDLPRPLLARVVQSWNIRLRQRLPVPILWARLLVLPDQWFPEPDANEAAVEFLGQDTAPPLSTEEAVRVARSGRSRISALDFEPNDPAPRVTLWVPVVLTPETRGVFVVRVALDFLEREVADRLVMGESGEAPTFVASLPDGRVIAHTDPKRVGTPASPEEQMILAAARRQPIGTMVASLPGLGPSLCAFATVSLVEIETNGARLPSGAARQHLPGFRLEDVAPVSPPAPPVLVPVPQPQGGGFPGARGGVPEVENPAWVVVALQPHRAVLARTAAFAAAIRQAASRAADTMEKEAKRRAAALVAATAPEQRRIAAEATAQIRAENQARVTAAVASLLRQQQQIAELAVRQAQTRSRAAAQETRQRMTERAREAAEQAGWALREQTRRSRRAGLMRMQQLTSLTANEAAARMVKNSLWLILLFLVLALLFAVGTARSLVRPIAAMAAGTAAIARGDFTKRVPVQSRDELGALARAFNHMADAVQRGRAELEASNARLAWEKSRIQAIVQSSPDGMAILDGAERATLLNPSARRLLRLPAEAPETLPFAQLKPYLGHPDEELLTPDGEARDLVLSSPHRVLQVRCVPIAPVTPGGQGSTIVAPHGPRPTPASNDSPPRFRTDLSEERFFSLPSEGSPSEDGEKVARPDSMPPRLLLLHDVTREREIDEMKSNFVALVSHELRTPLTSILGFSSYMLTGKLGPVTDAQRTGLESIHRQANRLKAIIADFLDIARIEAGKAEFRREPVVLADVIRRVIEDLRPQAMEKQLHVAFVAHCTSAEGTAIADEARVAQVLTNLLGNALKFTEAGGQVRVELARAQDRVLARVHDTGMGIPEEELPRIFDRFYQVEKVATRKAGGTGLGLSIVKNIVEALGGTVTVDSRVGEGTCFTVALPAADSR